MFACFFLSKNLSKKRFFVLKYRITLLTSVVSPREELKSKVIFFEKVEKEVGILYRTPWWIVFQCHKRNS